MQWGIPYWWAFLATLIISFAGGILIEPKEAIREAYATGRGGFRMRAIQ